MRCPTAMGLPRSSSLSCVLIQHFAGQPWWSKPRPGQLELAASENSKTRHGRLQDDQEADYGNRRNDNDASLSQEFRD